MAWQPQQVGAPFGCAVLSGHALRWADLRAMQMTEAGGAWRRQRQLLKMGEALKSIKKPSKIHQDPRLIKNCFEDVFPGEKTRQYIEGKFHLLKQTDTDTSSR